jgi:flagellar biosynthesis protein FliP
MTRSRLALLGLLCLLAVLSCAVAQAQSVGKLSLNSFVPTPDQPKELAAALKLLIGMSVLSLAPALLIMLTSFTRIIIIFSFLRSALGTQQTPPNAILIGLALFLTFFVMFPVWQQIDQKALKPYLAGQMKYDVALERASVPLREFLVRQTREKDLGLFVTLARTARPRTEADIPMRVLVPAFIISELRSGFQIGFVLFIPFVVVDLIVASVLMSMGMMMLPPVMISLPIKILLFVMVDGWHLITKSVVLSFG